MGDKEWVAENIFELFGDRLARNILLLLYRQPMAAEDLAHRFDVSKPTIYRRLNALSEYGLVVEQQEIDDSGHHYKIFETVLKNLDVELTEEKYEIELTKRRDIVEQFGEFWSDLEDGAPSAAGERTKSPDTDSVDGNLSHE